MHGLVDVASGRTRAFSEPRSRAGWEPVLLEVSAPFVNLQCRRLCVPGNIGVCLNLPNYFRSRGSIRSQPSATSQNTFVFNPRKVALPNIQTDSSDSSLRQRFEILERISP